MATILYGMAGEGRGHAVRARALRDALAPRHTVHFFAPHMARSFLADGPGELHSIPGLRFGYARDGRVDLWRTALGSLRFVAGMRKEVRAVTARMAQLEPDLVISDFEPLTARAARRLGVPCLGLDHQHFMVVSDLSALPARLRNHARWMGPVVRMVAPRTDVRAVSSFWFPPGKPSFERVQRLGVLLRSVVRRARPSDHGHLCVYLRHSAPRDLLQVLAGAGLPARIYGLGEQPPYGGLTFHAIDEQRFVEDLASARALLCTAGNQLIGEAAWLGKPVLAFPEPGNREQEMNAWLVELSGFGRRLAPERLEASALRSAIDAECRLARVRRPEIDGLPRAVELIERMVGLLPDVPNSLPTLPSQMTA
jgi:uncharacterized protein (TIGR00661 family)